MPDSAGADDEGAADDVLEDVEDGFVVVDVEVVCLVDVVFEVEVEVVCLVDVVDVVVCVVCVLVVWWVLVVWCVVVLGGGGGVLSSSVKDQSIERTPSPISASFEKRPVERSRAHGE